MASTNYPYIGNDNLYAPGSTIPYAKVGVYLYSSQKPSGTSKVQVRYGDHVKGFTEPYAGAHYYVQTSYTDTYASASTVINLNEVSVNGKKNNIRVRNGFLCLGLITEGSRMSHVDIDLGNGYFVNEINSGNIETNNLWCGFSYGNDKNTSGGSYKPDASLSSNMYVPVSASSVEIKVSLYRINSEDRIEGTMTFKSGSTIVRTAKVVYRGATGTLFKLSANGKPMCRFVRFMSLVPRGGDSSDDADSTTLNAKMRSLRLGTTYNGTPNVVWNKSYIDYAWSVQTANIRNLEISDLTWAIIGNDVDYINLVHDTQLH